MTGGGDGPPVYTKTGDDGSTGLLFGGRVSQADAVVEVCGDARPVAGGLGDPPVAGSRRGHARLAVALRRGPLSGS
jgi:cob(I)alamin adenosyltransferase